MPVGPFGEIIGMTGTLAHLNDGAQHYKSKVIAPRNPKLVRGEVNDFKMSPSQYMFEMSLNTEKKLGNMHTMSIPKKIELLDMSETTLQKNFQVNMDEPMFQPFPSEVFFQNYEAFETYEVPLTLRNNDRVPRLIKLIHDDSPYFKVISPANVGSKVGPGLPVIFKIQFTPDENKDYNHTLVCVTEREKFTIPVKAIGTRAILDFPDDVHFSVSPVKYLNTRTLLVRNIGNRQAQFNLFTEKPFVVSPEIGNLQVNESMQITVEFKPVTSGDHMKDLILQYDTGEDICIKLYGAAQDANVRLDKNSIRIENTFISMANQRSVIIHNRSDVMAHFRWTKYATQEEEDQQKMSLYKTLEEDGGQERDRFLEECLGDPSLRDKMSILNRSIQNKKRLVSSDGMLFDDDVIKLEPVEGDIWPNSFSEISIIFKPEESQSYTRTVFCDVTGRECRLPLRIRGDAMGPKVQFSFDELDMGNVFVNSTHHYEVVLANKGDIDAIFNLLPSNSVFGPCFTFNPSEAIVMPDGHQAIQVTFYSETLGEFKEDFFFQVDGSPETLKLTFNGSVIGPTFHFDVSKLKFGTVSYGFTSSQTCTLSNTALVPMTFNLRVPADGVTESISSTSEVDSVASEAGSMLPPKEFEIIPSSSTLEPQSEVKVQVKLCSNTLRKYDLALVVDVEGVGDEILSLPISAKCVTPQIMVLTPVLDYGRCFIRYPYEHHVKLQNDSDLPAKYELVPQQIDDFTVLEYTTTQPKGIIEPRSVMEVPVIVTPRGLEELDVTAYFVIFGSPEPPLSARLTCIGEGPVVHIMPLALDWSQLPVLTNSPKKIRLSNESLIPARFTALMVRPNSVWRVEPEMGEIPPEGQLELMVTAYLNDCAKFQDKLQLNIVDGPCRSIPLSATGFGTTIVTDPPMCPDLNLGPLFSKGPCKRTFTLTNCGRRHQSLVWTSEGFSYFPKPKRAGALAPLSPKDMKFKDNPPPPEKPKPIFRLTPHRMELNPGESIDVDLEGFVDTPQTVKERMQCHAIIGRSGGKELIMRVLIKCQFISPLVEFSTDKVFFRFDKNPHDELHVLREDLEMTNVSSLPLTTTLSLCYPFQIIDDNQEKSEVELYVGVGETKTLTIQFDPAYKDDFHIRLNDEVIRVSYNEHPHVDTVALRGEVYFPNLAFEKSEVNFGCILNDTEVTRYVYITNNSPMDVHYQWSFLLDGEPIAVFHPRPPIVIEPPLQLEDMEDGIVAQEEDSSQGSQQGDDDQPAEAGSPVPVDNTDNEQQMVDKTTEETVEPSKDADKSVKDKIEDNENLNKVEVDNKEREEKELTQSLVVESDDQPEKGELEQRETEHEDEEEKLRSRQDEPELLFHVATPRGPLAINPALASLLQPEDDQREQLGVEEIFDILPLYGTLKPGHSEQIALTFYGHADIGSKAKAICEVEGGPTYEVLLKGESSLVEYRFDCLDIDYGKIMYDEVSMAEITLLNTGRVGFDFTALGMDPGMASKPKPGIPVMIPHTGYIEPFSERTLNIKFLAGVPEKFHKSFLIQVAHFEPDALNLFGEGVFPRIALDLPREADEDGLYECLVKDAKENLTKETRKPTDRAISGVSTQRQSQKDEDFSVMQNEAAPSDVEIQMEVERLVVQGFALDQQEQSNHPDILALNDNENKEVRVSRDSNSKKSVKRPKLRPRLPDYVLDFGHIVLGTVRTHIVRATNIGWFPASFSVDRSFLYDCGFNVELDRVRNLPGAPDHETVDFVISFDPRGANLGLGRVETVVPINAFKMKIRIKKVKKQKFLDEKETYKEIVHGPQVCVHLVANVTMPDMQISTDTLDFENVRCGECKVVTVQMYNHKPVRCEWNSHPVEKQKKVDKYTPLHLRRKIKPSDKAKMRTFEMMPPTGFLMPGQRQNVQVKFMPTEEKYYEQRIVVRLAQSSQRILMLCRGQGQEPHVEFERNLVEFGPILPHSAGDEQEVIVRNPCKFPIEIYNLEFDKAFLEEEKILRLMKGYDECNTILLPPRHPHEKLPQELLDYYEEQMRRLEEQERQLREAEEAAEAAKREQEETEGAEESGPTMTTNESPPAGVNQEIAEKTNAIEATPDKQADTTPSKEELKEVDDEKALESVSSMGVGELEITPVSAAIARHLGIDLSPEGKAARNRRGIAIILHGAPLSGKTSSAVSLAKRYEAALLTVDGIIMEAISNGNTPAGLRARELCAEAAHRFAEEQRALEGDDTEKKLPTGGLSVEAVTAHTQGTVLSIAQVAAAHSVAHSIVSNRKTSTISDQKSRDKHHGSTGPKAAAAASTAEGGSQVPSSPPPLMAPIARRLSISASVSGEDGLMSCVLPEDLLVEILQERLLLNDCHRGVVFDGLETLFSLNLYTAAHAILKALNNRKYMYFVSLKLDYHVMKEQEKKAEEDREKRAREKEEKERRLLEEMSEDEYDAMSEEQKAQVDKKRLEIKKERLRREMEEKQEREKERLREEAEAELRKQEEEKLSKRKKKPDAKDAKKGQGKLEAKSQDRVSHLKSQEVKKAHGDSDHSVSKTVVTGDRPDSHTTDRGESVIDGDRKKRSGKRPISNDAREGKKDGKKGKAQEAEEEDGGQDEPVRDPAEILLMQRFRTFEHTYKEICELVDHWERATGIVRPATPTDGQTDGPDDASHQHPASGRKVKKIEKHEKGSKDKETEKRAEKGGRLAAAPVVELKEQSGGESGDGEDSEQITEEEKKEKRLEEGIGIPQIIIDCSVKDKPTDAKITDTGKLPSVEEVLDGLGLGLRGPPIPPPADFAVVPYPVKRHAPPGAETGHYIFVASSNDDPNIGVDDRIKDEEDDEKSITPDGRKDDHSTPTKGRSKTDKQAGTEKQKEKRKTSAKGKPSRRISSQVVSPPPGTATSSQDIDGSGTIPDSLREAKTPKLSHFRWVIPAEGDITLRLRFTSETLGQFDQTLNYEIMGTRRRYQVYCRGVCAFPAISREPRIVFPHRKKSKKVDEILHKKYILISELFEFGPLLVGKSRDRYKEGKYPENMETLTMQNTSPLDADVSFCFLNDSKAETFLLDPPTMQLKPGESKELRIWAYPKVPNTYTDALVCCIRENPEPVVFKLECFGVRPELELDRKILQFDKVLLHRKDTKTLYLRNSTLLPVQWRLNGLENLGDDFSVSQESGVIEAKSEFALHAYFRAMKAVTTNRRAIRLEVSDKDNIMGLVQTEQIHVHAEAYDVALDMSFPRGADGGIDFDVLKVFDEMKLGCSMKNKGKYDISYSFILESSDECPAEYLKMFSIIPDRGTLTSSDRPAQVQVIFKSTKEVIIKDQPILRCQVIEPSIGSDGETIASIPIKVSVRSVFSKYNIYPVNDINFGAIMASSKKTKTFVIENKSDKFDFKYTITKLIKDIRIDENRGKQTAKRTRSRDGSSSGRSAVAKPKRTESIRQDIGGNQSRLVLGMFTIAPAMGYILAGGHQTITVDCMAESASRCEEEIAIDVAGRDPSDSPGGIPYRLVAEACVPSINIKDIGSIFEEHRICKNLNIWQHTHNMESGGVYGEDEKKFVFNNVLVGAKAKARIKVSNPNKVPCDVALLLKPVVSKHTAKHQDVFEIDTQKSQISPHSHIYVTVSFCPPSMQQFSAIFEASIDNVSQAQAKGRSLIFEVSGEGNLPRIFIQKPTVRNKKGQALLLFKRNLIGQTETLPLVITNEGTLPSKVDVDLTDPDGVFNLRPTIETQAVSKTDGSKRMPHAASVIVNVGESASFDVRYRPLATQRSQAHIKLSVLNNQFEDSVIQLVGEGYFDDITLDNIHSVITNLAPEQEPGNMADDDVEASKTNLMKFGDCSILEHRTLSFSMTNRSKTDCIRFQWPELPELKFSPLIGHLHAGCTKDMSVTFKAEKPITFEEHCVPCKVMRITFDKPMDEVADWDDRIRSVKWVDVASIRQPADSLENDQKLETPLPSVSGRPTKKKVVETEPEPPHSEVPESGRTVDLLVSAVSDYCKFKCKTESIHFRDTLMFQTRVYQFQIVNKGTVTMNYNWQIILENFSAPGHRAVTFATHTESRPVTAAALVVRTEHGRRSSVASSVSSDVPYFPFTIEPEIGSIAPGKKTDFTIKFSPLDVNEFEGRLICSVSNLEADKQGPVIGIKGRSLMPYCHFELEDSDYIRNARRNPELRGPKGAPAGSTLDPNTRVIEFTNVGLGVKSTRKFSIVNPTNQAYSYSWVCDDEENPKSTPDFVCRTQSGQIRSGKKTEVCFEFTTSLLDLVESFWTFVIPEQNITVPFLLVGHTHDPNISLDRSHLNFKSLLVGHEAMQTVQILNGEDTPFHFSFVETTCHSAGHSASLKVSPMSGFLPPNSSIPIQVKFAPTSAKEVNFNVICNVKKKTMPLMLNVKAEGYSMDCLVLCEDSNGNKVELSSDRPNQLNFADVEVNEKAVRNIYIINSGKFNFDYTWEMQERATSKDKMVSISPEKGPVQFGQRRKCQLSFCPTRQTALRGCELILGISNGPIYVMQVNGNGIYPGLHFSFSEYNFGPCFLHRAGMPTHSTVLTITNTDKKDISLDCLYERGSHLHHDFEAQVITPKQQVNVNFAFYPREVKRYVETITFEVNGLSKQSVKILGQGTDMKVEVADPKQKVTKFGALRVGQVMRRIVPIVNNSLAPISFHLAITPSNSLLQDKNVLRLHPTSEITLQPKGGTAKVEVIFSPTCRIAQFTEEVVLECAGLFQPLFVVNGFCQGIDISLDTDAIPFSPVIQRSSTTRKLVMLNTGDIGAKFKWEVSKFAPDFGISPGEGYISPGMQVQFDVIFQPQEINNDIRYESLKCHIENSKPLKLTLTGSCGTIAAAKEVVTFNAHVRSKDVKNVMVHNKTNMNWNNIRPIVEGDHFIGADTFTVAPQSMKQYEITYKPISMTTEGKKHTGSVFFPLPDGTGLLYNLVGNAEPAKAISKNVRDVPCKTNYTELLAVTNWLKKPQRFRVKTDPMRPERLEPGTTLKGLDYIDVPGNSKRDYKLNFYSHKEGQYIIKITFINEQSGEYQFYELTFRAIRPGVISTIDLTTPVRQRVSYSIVLENPLNYVASFSASCNVQEVLMPAQLSVPALAKGAFNLEYLPLKVGDTTGRLEFNCTDLGLYMYDLNLKATPAGAEKALYFRACLGTSQAQVGKFLNFARVKTDYVCKVDNNEFHVDKSIAAAPGSSSGMEVSVEVTYEPSKIGESRGTLTVSSNHGGDYTFPLFGTCVIPKPQGPHVIKAGGTTSLTFRNVFQHTTAFTFQVDNPLFHVTKSGEQIRARKDHRLVVGFDGNDSGSKAAVMGKLIVSCAKSAGGTSSVQWVYYLKGITPESK